MQKKFNNNGFFIKNLSSPVVIKKLLKIVNKHFNKSKKYYLKINRREFSQIVLKCQRDIDKSNIVKLFHKYESNFFKKILNDNKVFYSSAGYLRAVRPSINLPKKEYLDWHRETFYGRKKKFIKSCVNVWVPVKHVNKLNSLKYIPKSHKIKDNLIKRKRYKVENESIKKLSTEHKIGFAYAPKKIISGINLKKQKTFNFKKNQFVSFSAMLVHGNAKNLSKDIRFAFNFGIVGGSKLQENYKKIDSRNHRYISFDN